MDQQFCRPLHEHRKEVRLAVRKVGLGEVLKLRVHVFTAHIRRVGHHHVILRRQRLGHAQHGQDARLHLLQQQVAAEFPRLHHPQRLCRIAQFRHDQRAEVLGLPELLKRLAQLVREHVAANHCGHVLHLGLSEGHVLQNADIGLCLHPQPPQFGRRLHRQRKGGQRARAVVNLHSRQVMRQDQRGDLGRVISLFLVDGVE